MDATHRFDEWPFDPIPDDALSGSIIERFRRVAAGCPADLAVADIDRSITYGELADAVERLARSIASAVRERDGPVAILMPHDARYPMALLAVLAAGRGYVPLDADHPAERNARIVTHARVAAIVASGETAAAAEALSPGSPVIDVDRPTDAPGSGTLPRPGPDDLAWVTYTSGSTGVPKGAFQNHRGVLLDIAQSVSILWISRADRLCMFNPPSHIQGSRIALGALLTGAAVHVLSPRSLSPAELAGEIRARGVTIFRSVAAVFARVVERLGEGERFDRLRLVYLGGDRVGWADYDRFRRSCPPGAAFGTHFGATECSTYLHWLVDERLRRPGTAPPVGRPLPGRTVRLLDDDGRPVSAGEVGEFVVASRFNVLGYWNEPALTANAFAVDPGDPGARVFRTGDLGRLRPDGLYEFVGRKDRQVKISGIRIEPGEVEQALRNCDGINEAVVVVRRNPDGAAKALVAYVEPIPGVRGLKPRHVMAMAAQMLPRSMMPALVFVEPALPRLVNLKVDRGRVLEIDRERAEPGRLDPTDALTDRVIDAFESALKVSGATADDNLMSLGADSLQAVQVIEELQARFAVAIPEDVFESAGSIRELAEWLRTAPGRTRSTAARS